MGIYEKEMKWFNEKQIPVIFFFGVLIFVVVLLILTLL